MSAPTTPPALEPKLGEHRMRRQWDGIQTSLVRTQRTQRAMLGSAVAVCAALGIAAGWLTLRPGAPVATVARTLRLPDGSQLTLSDAAEIQLVRAEPEVVELTLERGTTAVAVRKNAARRFSVRAGGVEVTVVGTKFEVALEASGATRVAVAEGVVQVALLDGSSAPFQLSAGQTWSSAPRPAPPLALSGPALDTPPAEPSPSFAKAPPPRGTAPLERAAEQMRRRRPASPPKPQLAARVDEASPPELLEIANGALMEADFDHAALAFDHLRRRFPNDVRAGLAAVELGRLRMDHLGDVPGAIEALENALALAPRSALREDAEARLIHAYERSGKVQRCRELRAGYLSRYPRGAHRSEVAGRCTPP